MLDKILNKITTIITEYENGSYVDLHKAHRELTCNIFKLSLEQVKAHQNWNKQYYLSEHKTNAAKERECDKLVPELYLCRKVMETAKGVSIAMSLEVKMN